jgi:hypothetical protein
MSNLSRVERSVESAATRDEGDDALRLQETRMRIRAVCHVLGLVLALGAAAMIASQAQATWKPEYANNPPEVQEWYRNAELTEAAKIRFPFKKCCDHADVVKTRFNVNKTSKGDEWYWLDGDQWRRIPDDIIHWGRRAPDGQPTLFIYSGKETCFFPGDSGI